jgi:hypothetical protein
MSMKDFFSDDGTYLTLKVVGLVAAIAAIGWFLSEVING